MEHEGPIGIFDSGYGGLTVFREIEKLLPQYEYIYFGDNARVPYGNRSFDTIHAYTWECVTKLIALHCPLIILACNTASAKALRNIQQLNLPAYSPTTKVLGVIRPTTEMIGRVTTTGCVGIFATHGTVTSESYVIEIKKFFPSIEVYQQACPMWVPMIENEEFDSEGGDYFIKKYIDMLMAQCSRIDTIILACTHYPILYHKIKSYLPHTVKVLSQGDIVAHSLTDYLDRHHEISSRLIKSGSRSFFTTDDARDFDRKAKLFLGREIASYHITL